MKIKIIRDRSSDYGTPGTLFIADLNWTCRTLELPWRNNNRGVSCVVADTYQAAPWYSKSMARDVLRLEDKHGRRDCLVHTGNWAGDSLKGFHTQIHGCTLVGSSFGSLAPEGKKEQFAILRSVATLKQLLAAIGVGPHSVQYEWSAGCVPSDLSDHLA